MLPGGIGMRSVLDLKGLRMVLDNLVSVRIADVKIPIMTFVVVALLAWGITKTHADQTRAGLQGSRPRYERSGGVGDQCESHPYYRHHSIYCVSCLGPVDFYPKYRYLKRI